MDYYFTKILCPQPIYLNLLWPSDTTCCHTYLRPSMLTHWGWVTHICMVKLTIIGSDNGLSPEWHQAINWTNIGILLIEPLGKILNEILIGIQTFSFEKRHLKMSSAKWRLFCLGLNVLINHLRYCPSNSQGKVCTKNLESNFCGFFLHHYSQSSFCITKFTGHLDGLVRDCRISIANAMGILQSCTKPLIWYFSLQIIHYTCGRLKLIAFMMIYISIYM